jgi:hypothetical protein
MGCLAVWPTIDFRKPAIASPKGMVSHLNPHPDQAILATDDNKDGCMELSEVLPRGFLFSDKAFPGRDAGASVCRGHLLVDTRLPVHRVSVAGVEVVLLGYAIDLRRAKIAEPALVRRFCRIMDEKGEAAALDETAHWLGRFCLILFRDGRLLVCHDACATRPVYYGLNADRFVVASHSNLAASILDAPERADLRKYFRFGLPGFRTFFDGVRILPANFALDPASGVVMRYWPRQVRMELTPDEAFAQLEPLLLAAASAIRSRFRPAVSLTAGLDSRVTFALFKFDRETVFFTYDRGPIDQVDLAIARLIADRYEGAHKRLRTRDRTEAGRVYDLIDAIPDYRHIANIVPSYDVHFSAPGWIHVRSNLSEIGRAFWRRFAKPMAFSVARVARMSRRPNIAPDAALPEAEALSLGSGLVLVS